MRNIIQIIGLIIVAIIAICSYAYFIFEFCKSKKDKYEEAKLFERLTRTSAIGVVLIIIFMSISLIFPV